MKAAVAAGDGSQIQGQHWFRGQRPMLKIG